MDNTPANPGKLPRRLSYIGPIDNSREKELASLFKAAKKTNCIAESIPEALRESVIERENSCI